MLMNVITIASQQFTFMETLSDNAHFPGLIASNLNRGRGGSYFGGRQDVVLVTAEADVIHPIIVTLIKFNYDK